MIKYLIYVFVAIFFFIMGSLVKLDLFTNTYPPTTSTFDEKKLFDLVQRWRFENNLQPYTKSDKACSITEKRLDDTFYDWSHKGFDGDTLCDTSCKLGENLARDWSTEEETLTAWLKSASHAANLKADYHYSCLKCRGSRCVQIFANF